MMLTDDLWARLKWLQQGRNIAVCILWLALCLSTSGCSKHALSGQYLASTPAAVARLQLVETPDNRLSGQIEVSALQPDGKIQYINSAVNGAVDGPNVSLSLESAGPLQNPVQVSGTFSLDSLTLTGGFTGSHSSTLVMRGGDLDQYHAALAGLNKRAMAILAARRLADEEAAKVAKKAEISLVSMRNLCVVLLYPPANAGHPAEVASICAKRNGALF